MKTFLLKTLALLATTGLGFAAGSPNIIVLFADDLGYGDIGPFGATKQRTPHLDRMAREGLKFTSFYAAPVCSVSRAQLLTGCYGARVSVPGVYFPGGKNGLNPAEVTMAERLKERGYATACIGKWHLGDQPEFLPTRQGFDRYFGIPYSNDMQRRSAGGGERVVPLLRDDKVSELLTDADQSRLIERYTGEALSFIRQQKAGPFFLYFPHTAVHVPIHPGTNFAGKSANGRYGDWVEELDWSVGRILDTLRELGIEKNTLVLFTSDNGPWAVKGSDGGSAGPLRGSKGSTWEGGVRVPTLACWPGKIAPGTTCASIAGTIDLLPTFVTLAGGRVPERPVIDGRDISGLLFGNTDKSPREAHYYFAGFNLQAVRQGPWKLALAPQPRDTRKDADRPMGNQPRLYNLEQEIGENTDVSKKHPEIVAKLQALAVKMNSEIGGNNPAARRPAGEVQHPQTLYQIEESLPASTSQVAGEKVALDKLKPGDTLSARSAPEIARRPFRFACTIETEQKDAIVLAHGGNSSGYSLFLKNGRAAFAVRTGSGTNITEIITPAELKFPALLEASLSSDGTMLLKVNDSLQAKGKAPRLIQRQPKENFCVGHDDGLPVTGLPVTNVFTGKITNLKLETNIGR